jgi:hypothetical protein
MSSMTPAVNQSQSVAIIPLHKPTLGYRMRRVARALIGRKSQHI